MGRAPLEGGATDPDKRGCANARFQSIVQDQTDGTLYWTMRGRFDVRLLKPWRFLAIIVLTYFRR